MRTDQPLAHGVLRAAGAALISYSGAALAAGAAFTVVSLVASLADPLAPNQTRVQASMGLLALFPVASIMAAVFAAPIALVAIAASKIFGWQGKIYFALAGAVSALPLLLRQGWEADGRILADALIVLPVGAIGGLVFCVLRRRLSR